MSSFEKTGVYPLNPQTYDHTKLGPNKVWTTRQKQVSSLDSSVVIDKIAFTEFLPNSDTAINFDVAPCTSNAPVRKTVHIIVSGKAITEVEVAEQVTAHYTKGSKGSKQKQKILKVCNKATPNLPPTSCTTAKAGPSNINLCSEQFVK